MPSDEDKISSALRGAASLIRQRIVKNLLLAISIVLTFGTCSVPDPDRVPRSNLVTGSTGGSWYTIGSAISERTNVSFDGHPLTAVPGAGGISNPARIAKVLGDLGMSFLPFLRAAYRGDPPYRQAYSELRFIAAVVKNKLHLLISDRLGVAGLNEVREGRLAVRLGTGPPGSGEEFLLRECLSFYGISYEDVLAWGGRIDLLGTSERGDAWRDHHVDVIAFTINEPAAIITELLSARPGRIWSVPRDVRQALTVKWRLIEETIAGGLYPGHDEDIPTVGMAAVIFSTDDVSEEIVYELTKTIAENKEYLEKVHAGFRRWEPEDMVAGVDMPLHRGAERYYRERGWVRP